MMPVEPPRQSAEGSNLDEQAFEAHIAPARDALAGLLDASDQLRDEWGYMPAADSQAMAELAAGTEFKGSSAWGDPVHAAHNWGHTLLFSTGDCARALIRVLSQGASPVYAHVVLARASLEHAGRASWLFEPAIGLRLRVARVMNERIFGLYERSRLTLTEEDLARASKRRNELFAEATRLGFQTVSNPSRARRYLEEMRPSQTKLIEKLLSGDGDTSLGALVYGAFSAIAHGTTFGLMSRVSADAPNAPRTPGVRWGAAFASSGEVVSVLTAVILGTKKAYQLRNELFGWSSQSCSESAAHAIQVAISSFPPPKTS